MKRNKPLRIAAIFLALVLISTCAMTGTLAKYITTFTPNGATVRAGIFKVDGVNATGTNYELLEIGLGVEDEAAQYAGDKATTGMIVPGSIVKLLGSSITNYSEVDVVLTIDSIVTTGTSSQMLAKILWSANGTSGWKALTAVTINDLTGVAAGTDVLLKAAPNGSGNVATFAPSYLKWDFTASDTVADESGDTAMGLAQAGVLLDSNNDFDTTGTSLHDAKMSFVVTATQKD